MLYEAVLLFGVVFFAGYLYSTLLQQRHALMMRNGLQAWLFCVLGIYFIWFWSHGGQTLPMKTWRIRVMDNDGQPLMAWRALGRYLASWMMFLPGLVLTELIQAKGWLLVLLPTLNLLIWAILPIFLKEHQFLHDKMAGTRLVIAT